MPLFLYKICPGKLGHFVKRHTKRHNASSVRCILFTCETDWTRGADRAEGSDTVHSSVRDFEIHRISRGFLDFTWISRGFLDFTWISRGFLDFTWISRGFLDFMWISSGFWISHGFPDFAWISSGFLGLSWISRRACLARSSFCITLGIT